jgi:protein AATF/BFR2
MHNHVTQVLDKWSHKVQSVAPNALLPSKRTAFRQQVTPKSAVQLIQEAVGDGRPKAIGRTRIRRGQSQARIGAVLGTSNIASDSLAEVHEGDDAEVFDDTDFYQDMLRDVIDAKTGRSQSFVRGSRSLSLTIQSIT